MDRSSTLSGPSLALPRRRRSAAGLIVSLTLHILVIILVLAPWGEQLARVLILGGSAPGTSGGGGGGGSREAYISLPASSAQPAPPVTKPVEALPEVASVVTPEPVPIAPPQDTAVPLAAATSQGPGDTAGESGPGSAGGTGGGNGGGVGPGSGPGSGPGTGGGEGAKGVGPQPKRFIIPPENKPKELRGQVILLVFWIDEAGKVQKVQLDPEIRDRGYAKKFLDALMGYEFRPARGPDGLPVAAKYEMKITL